MALRDHIDVEKTFAKASTHASLGALVGKIHFMETQGAQDAETTKHEIWAPRLTFRNVKEQETDGVDQWCKIFDVTKAFPVVVVGMQVQATFQNTLHFRGFPLDSQLLEVGIL